MARETWFQSQVESYQRLKKMILCATSLNIQHYEIWIKGKVEQSRERSSALPYALVLELSKRKPSGPLDYGRQRYIFHHSSIVSSIPI